MVSTNWRLDYFTKLLDYEEIGIKECWIVDYLGLGAKRLIGNPKQPTVLVYSLVEGEYWVNLFCGNQSELELNANHIFPANSNYTFP